MYGMGNDHDRCRTWHAQVHKYHLHGNVITTSEGLHVKRRIRAASRRSRELDDESPSRGRTTARNEPRNEVQNLFIAKEHEGRPATTTTQQGSRQASTQQQEPAAAASRVLETTQGCDDGCPHRTDKEDIDDKEALSSSSKNIHIHASAGS